MIDRIHELRIRIALMCMVLSVNASRHFRRRFEQLIGRRSARQIYRMEERMRGSEDA